MAGVINIDIEESIEQLEALITQPKKARLKERRQTLYLIKAQSLSVSRIAAIPTPSLFYRLITVHFIKLNAYKFERTSFCYSNSLNLPNFTQ
jgi:hypothetical protein